MKERARPYAYWSALIATLGGCLQGYVTCVIAGALPLISREFALSPAQEGLIASAVLLGALAGACLSVPCADRIGRKPSLGISAALYLLTALLAVSIHSFFALCLLRVATGIAVGMTSLLVPLYLAEIAPASQRGAFVTAFQLSQTVGTLLAYLSNHALCASCEWRMMFALAALPAGAQLLSFFSIPESPQWLIGAGRLERGANALARLQLETAFQPETPMTPHNTPWEILRRPHRRVLWIGILLSLSQQLVGITAIVFFTPTIFALSGAASAKEAMALTLILGAVNLFSTFLSSFLVDRCGRRRLLLLSQAGVLLSLSLLTASASLGALAGTLGSLLSYIFFFSLGLGPATWVVISEIYPLPIRAKAIAAMILLNWSGNYLVVLTFPMLLASFSLALACSFYALVSLASLFLFFRFIPETKGKSLEHLSMSLQQKKE